MTPQGGEFGSRWLKAFEPAENLLASMSGQSVAGLWWPVEARPAIDRGRRRPRSHIDARIVGLIEPVLARQCLDFAVDEANAFDHLGEPL